MTVDPTPCIALSLPGGDRARIALFGGHVLSWQTADGVERLYLSPDAVFDQARPIRGGVPVCFPQFNTRGPLPKHGIARILPWQADVSANTGAAGSPTDSVRLRLRDSNRTRRWWPQAFEAALTVTLAPRRLRIALDVLNSDSEPWSFTVALHSYLRVEAIREVRLAGLQNHSYWDALTDRQSSEGASEIAFDGPFDRVYRGITRSARLEVREPRGTLALTQSASLTEVVVWNPGAALSATLPDMPDDGFSSMLCVEAAKIDAPVLLTPGQRWQGWQEMTLAPNSR